MKIGIESQRIFRRRKHGMDVVAVELIKQLQQLDTVNQYTLYAKEGPDNGCVVETGNFKVDKLKALTYGDWEQIVLPNVLRKHKPDLIHCTANTAPVFCPVPLVLTLHDIIFLRETSFEGTAYQNFGNLYRRFIVPPVMNKARMIITVSEEEKKIIMKECGTDPAKIDVVHNAVDARFSQQHPAEEVEQFRRRYQLPPQFILHLGNTAPKKNTGCLIQAYTEYCANVNNPLPLVIADYPAHLLFARLGELSAMHLSRKIFLPGYIPSTLMPLLYSCCSLFVYPSLLESFGLPVLEAMASGKPVITSPVAALREVAGDAAKYANPESAADIAMAISDVLDNSDEYSKLTEFGKQRAELFSWRKSAEKLLRIYQNVLR